MASGAVRPDDVDPVRWIPAVVPGVRDPATVGRPLRLSDPGAAHDHPLRPPAEGPDHDCLPREPRCFHRQEERLAVGRPLDPFIGSRSEQTTTASVRSDDIEVARPSSRAVRHGHRLAVWGQRRKPLLLHHAAEAGAVRARDVDPFVRSVPRVPVRDRAAVARHGHRLHVSAAHARRERRQPRAVRPDAVGTRLAVAIACDHEPVPARLSRLRGRCVKSGCGDRSEECREQACGEEQAPHHRSSDRGTKTTRPPSPTRLE
jgi:hypothetical protein